LNDQTKHALIESGVVTRTQIAEAEAASGNGPAFNDYLAKNAGLDESPFMHALAHVHNMPHIERAKLNLTETAKQLLSEHCIKRWNVLPLDIDLKQGIMTLAVGSPEQAKSVEQYFKFLMEPFDLGFVLVNESAIPELIDSICKPEHYDIQTPTDEPPTDEPVTAPHVAQPLPEHNTSDKKNEPEKAIADAPESTDQGPTGSSASIPDELTTSLTSAISLLVNAHIGGNAHALASVKERVRYCQLTASRLGLKPVASTKVVLAAWLSSLADRQDVISQFACPFDLDAILFAEESEQAPGTEALILSLVKVYQQIRLDMPESARDAGVARRGLFMHWPFASQHQDILETFLQVLMDEQFIEKLDRQAARVCIFASGGRSVSALVDCFQKSGYFVKLVSTFEDVKALAQGNRMDLLIVSAAGNGRYALTEIKRIKESPALVSIPMMAAIGPDGGLRGADLLRAGVDDFITDPIDMEVLLLKAEKLLRTSTSQQDHAGVTGSLADMSFSDLVQVLSAGGKSMDVSVTHKDLSGRIVLRDGSIVHAEAGNVVGEQAFYTLMQWKTGQFSVSECADFPEPTVTASTMSLLMEGARIADEGEALQ
jgi:DNA-binding response OmpR family regulator